MVRCLATGEKVVTEMGECRASCLHLIQGMNRVEIFLQKFRLANNQPTKRSKSLEL